MWLASYNKKLIGTRYTMESLGAMRLGRTDSSLD